MIFFYEMSYPEIKLYYITFPFQNLFTINVIKREIPSYEDTKFPRELKLIAHNSNNRPSSVARVLELTPLRDKRSYPRAL